MSHNFMHNRTRTLKGSREFPPLYTPTPRKMGLGWFRDPELSSTGNRITFPQTGGIPIVSYPNKTDVIYIWGRRLLSHPCPTEYTSPSASIVNFTLDILLFPQLLGFHWRKMGRALLSPGLNPYWSVIGSEGKFSARPTGSPNRLSNGSPKTFSQFQTFLLSERYVRSISYLQESMKLS